MLVDYISYDIKHKEVIKWEKSKVQIELNWTKLSLKTISIKEN